MNTTPIREDSYTEFKSNFSDAAIETLTAFANTKGGKVFIGLDDAGKPIQGFVLGPETLQKWVNEVKNKTQPSIIPDVGVIQVDGNIVGEITIKEFPVKPVAFRGRYLKRIKNSNHQLSPTEISDLHLQSLQLSWDSYPNQDAQFNDLNKEKIALFINKVNNGGRFLLPEDAYEAMLLLKLIKRDAVTNAAMILFSKGNLFYNVHIGRFKSPSLIIDERMINGNLFDVVEETSRFINSHLKVAFEIKDYPTMTFSYQEQGNGFVTELAYIKQKINLNAHIMPATEGLIEGLNEGLNEGLKSLLSAISKKPGIQAKDLPALLDNRPLKTIERQIKELVAQKLIERRGSRKTGGYWTIVKNPYK
jgi:ATP-dependent DNA helicase RecG